jgi:hypothetical protein
MEVMNATSGKHLWFPMKDRDGRDLVVVVLTYTLKASAQGSVELLQGDDAADPCLADECHGEDPATSSIRRPSDLFDYKPGTDVLLLGHAHPAHAGATATDVTLRVGPVNKTVRVHGFRVWQPGTFRGLSPGPALPIREPVPLRYELAWGGLDASDPKKLVGEPRNTLGRGVARDPKRLVGTPATQLEDPRDPQAPAGFGAIHRHWSPRREFAGTYDERWTQTRMPLLPADFDARFHVAVPHDQWVPAGILSDTPVEVLGATPDRAWYFQLPRLAPGFSSSIRGSWVHPPTHLDRLLVDADTRRIELTYRAAIPAPSKLELIDQVRIVEKKVLG